MATARVNGVTLEYDVLGDGPDLVWLHGLGGNLELERRSAQALAQHFRVLWYSSRGHGRSTAPADRGGWSYGRLADDLDALLDEAGFDRPLLAGGSHGANTILRHAVDHPGRARALFVIAPGGNALARPSRRTFAPIWLTLQLARLKGQDGLVRFITGFSTDNPDLDPAVLAAARTHDRRVLYRALRRIPDQGAVEPGRLAAITTPTVVAAWAGDPVIHPITVARQIADLIPGARFEEIDNVAATAPEEVPAVLTSSVLRWSAAPPVSANHPSPLSSQPLHSSS